MLSEAKLITDIVLKSCGAIVSFLLLAILVSTIQEVLLLRTQTFPTPLSASAQLR